MGTKVIRDNDPAGEFGGVGDAPRLVVDIRQAAAIIGANEADVRGWVADGSLPCVRYPSRRRPGEPSRRILIALVDLEDFVERHKEVAPAPNAALSRAQLHRWRKRAIQTADDDAC